MAKYNTNLLLFCFFLQCLLIFSQNIESNSNLEQQDVFQEESSGMGEDLRSPSEINTKDDVVLASTTTTTSTTSPASCFGVFVRPALSCPICNTDLDCEEGQSCCPLWFPRSIKCCGNRISLG